MPIFPIEQKPFTTERRAENSASSKEHVEIHYSLEGKKEKKNLSVQGQGKNIRGPEY